MPKHKVRKRTSYADPQDYIIDHVVLTQTGCWVWQGVTRKGGYPSTSINGQTVSLARYSYEAFIGSILEGFHVLHTCDNPGCVNPEHLFLGTHQENMLDMQRKGRHPGAKLSYSKICKIIKRAGQGVTRRALATEYGVSLCTIRNVLKGKTWQWMEGVEKPGPLPSPQVLTEVQVREIKLLLGRVPYTQIALKFGVSRRAIYDIRKGKTWAGVE